MATSSATATTALMDDDDDGGSSSNKNNSKEIWATRIQQELLSLTTTTSTVADDDGGEHAVGSSSSSCLPPFCQVSRHDLNLEAGTCIVYATLRLSPTSSSSSPSSGATTTTTAEEEQEEEEMISIELGVNAGCDAPTNYPFRGPVVTVTAGSAYLSSGSSSSSSSSSTVVQWHNGDIVATDDLDWTPSLRIADVLLHVSLKIRECIWRGEILRPAGGGGKHVVPPEESPPHNNDNNNNDTNDPMMMLENEFHELTRGARQLASKWGERVASSTFGKALASSSSSPSTVAAAARQSIITPKKAVAALANSTKAAFATPQKNKSSSPPTQQQPRRNGSPQKNKSDQNVVGQKMMTTTTNKKKEKPNMDTVVVGDEINWLEEPWVQAHGVYSCKAIRRPAFVEQMMMMVPHNNNTSTTTTGAAKTTADQQHSSTNHHNILSPSAMFRNLAKSARSVMDESFLMVTSTHLLELKANKLNMQHIGTVVFCIPIHQLAKLKFRRHESVSLFFKPPPASSGGSGHNNNNNTNNPNNDDPLVYLCPDSGDAVHQIQTVLKRLGVRGKHTNASAYRAINEAMLMVQDIQTKEFAVEHAPSVARVNEIMDLYRQAAEKFESAGDIRHEEVLRHMKQFLAKPSTVAVLDGSFQKQQKFIPHGEVLETSLETAVVSSSSYDDDDEDTKPPSADVSREEDENFANSIDSLLKDAKEDFGNFHLDDDEEDAILASGGGNGGGGGASGHAASGGDDHDLADMAADLDEMMKEADKELAELMNS
jgi:hypothetical protein